MPLDPGDPYYLAEDISPTIAAMEHPLCDAYGVGLDHFGSKGNEVHQSGYHRSRNWILHSPDSRYGSSDYSVQLAADNGDHDDDVSAFDFTPGAWGTSDNRAKMITLTTRLIQACQRHDPLVANLREVAGTLDGSHVVTWDCSRNAFKSPFDSSHLDHIHGSFYRSRTRWSQAGIVSVMLGEDMALTAQELQLLQSADLSARQANARVEALLKNLANSTTPTGTAGNFAQEPNALRAAILAIPTAPVDIAALVAALVPVLAPALADALPDNIDSESVINAFQDPAVQAVLEAQAFAGAQRAEGS